MQGATPHTIVTLRVGADLVRRHRDASVRCRSPDLLSAHQVTNDQHINGSAAPGTPRYRPLAKSRLGGSV
jgi:hypothetical protein